MKRVFSFQAVLYIFLLTASVLAKDVWLAGNSPNFHLTGNADEKNMRETALKLETFHNSFQSSFNKIRFQSPFPGNVLVFREGFNPFKQNQYFLAAEDANYLIVSLEKNSSGNYQKIFHDYVHFLINNNLGNGKIPAWLNEGLAEYFTNPTRESSLLAFQQDNLFSLDILLETDNFTLQNQDEERKAIFNAQSWALLSFLIVEKGGGRFEQMENFIGHLQAGKDVREASILTFQINLKKLENEYRQFLKEPKLLINSDLATIPAFKDVKFSTISEAQSLAVLGDYLYYAKRPKEAVEMLEKSLKLEPNNSLALTTLALIKAKAFYYDEAAELAEKAVQNEPDNFLNYYRQALAMSKQGMTEFGFVSGYTRALAEGMRESLKKSIELNPNFPESYALLAFVNYVRNEDLDETLVLMKKVLQIAPGNQRYLLRLSEANLRKENFTEARKLALEVFETTPSDQLRLYSKNTIQRIDSTEYQLQRMRTEKAKYVNDDIVTDKPLSEEEIKKLREKATVEQIRAVLRRPQSDETKILGSLTKVECGKERVDFIFKTQTGLLKLQAKSFDGINLISFIEELADFRLGCGIVSRENNASIIYRKEKDSLKTGELVSIEFVPHSFKLQNQ